MAELVKMNQLRFGTEKLDLTYAQEEPFEVSAVAAEELIEDQAKNCVDSESTVGVRLMEWSREFDTYS